MPDTHRETSEKSNRSGTSKVGALGKGAIIGAVGMAGLHAAGITTTDDRYPLKDEYELVRTCIDGGNKRITFEDYGTKKRVCLCTIQNTTKALPYGTYKESPDRFHDVFIKASKKCQKERRP